MTNSLNKAFTGAIALALIVIAVAKKATAKKAVAKKPVAKKAAAKAKAEVSAVVKPSAVDLLDVHAKPERHLKLLNKTCPDRQAA